MQDLRANDLVCRLCTPMNIRTQRRSTFCSFFNTNYTTKRERGRQTEGQKTKMFMSCLYKQCVRLSLSLSLSTCSLVSHLKSRLCTILIPTANEDQEDYDQDDDRLIMLTQRRSTFCSILNCSTQFVFVEIVALLAIRNPALKIEFGPPTQFWVCLVPLKSA